MHKGSFSFYAPKQCISCFSLLAEKKFVSRCLEDRMDANLIGLNNEPNVFGPEIMSV